MLIYGYIKRINDSIIIGIIEIIRNFYGLKEDVFIAVFARDKTEYIIEFDISNEIKSKVYRSSIGTNYGLPAMYCFNDKNIYKVGINLGDNLKYNIETNKKICLPNNIIQRFDGDLLLVVHFIVVMIMTIFMIILWRY